MLKKIKTTKQMRLDELIKYVWDKHYDEVITLRFSDFIITLTRVYTYQNTYGSKYHAADYIEIQPNEAN